jgi:intracellular sulfur oxidation DsrE/DsrF family protein
LIGKILLHRGGVLEFRASGGCTILPSDFRPACRNDSEQLRESEVTDIDRRHVLAALAAGGAAIAGTTAARAAPKELSFADMKKDTEVACVYHCDFGDDKRYSAMLRNINNHLSVYDFDPFKTKIVIVAHSAGIKYHLKSLAGTPWEGKEIDPDLAKRMDGLAKYGVEVYLCKITFKAQKLDLSLAKDHDYIKLVPSGVATVASLQGKGFAYLKVG